MNTRIRRNYPRSGKLNLMSIMILGFCSQYLGSTAIAQSLHENVVVDTRPDLSARPHELVVERDLVSTPGTVFRAWTENFDQWFAAPGTLTMRPNVGAPFFFETRYDGQRHPHYGRFLKLVPNELIELTWINGDPGTIGAETVLTLELEPLRDGGTRVKLTHAGFRDEQSKTNHELAWPEILAILDQRMIDANKPITSIGSGRSLANALFCSAVEPVVENTASGRIRCM